MNTNPTLQTKLFGLDKIFSEIINLINLQKLPTKICFQDQKALVRLQWHIILQIMFFLQMKIIHTI